MFNGFRLFERVKRNSKPALRCCSTDISIIKSMECGVIVLLPIAPEPYLMISEIDLWDVVGTWDLALSPEKHISTMYLIFENKEELYERVTMLTMLTMLTRSIHQLYPSVAIPLIRCRSRTGVR